MGFINNDNYVCANGVEKAGTYISFAMEMINIRQVITVVGATFTPVASKYSVSSNYRVFWDKVCRDNGKVPIDTKSISIEITPEQLNENIYTVLYDELKKTYTNYTNEIVNVVLDAPVADTPVADAPVADAPVADAPVADAPVADAPVADAPVADAPVADEPSA